MGQYYYGAILKRKPYNKRTSHWLIEDARKNGRDASSITKLELYCAHDYDNGLKLMEHSYWGNNYAMTVESQLVRKKGAWSPPNFAVIGDYTDKDDVENGHDDTGYFESAIEARTGAFSDQYIVKNAKCTLDKDKTYYALNWTKKQYVRMDCCPEHDDEWPVRIDPLFLLCAVGNGRGGGDYHGINEDMVGKWAFDQIEITDSKPDETWAEFHPVFKEEW